MSTTGDNIARWVAVRPGLRFPRAISVVEGAWGADGYRAEVVAEWDEERVAYGVSSLKLERTERPVTAVGLRRFSVQDLLRFVVTRAVEDSEGKPVRNPEPGEFADLARMSNDSPLKHFTAARVYAVARAYGEAPLKAVSEAFDVSQSTATRIVARARELGMLD